MYEVSVKVRDSVATNGGSVTVQATPRRQLSRLSNPSATDSSKLMSVRPVIGQNCAGVRTASCAQPGSPPVQRPEGPTKSLYAQLTYPAVYSGVSSG